MLYNFVIIYSEWVLLVEFCTNCGARNSEEVSFCAYCDKAAIVI
ncbi:zinc ribbon domain-containing protein [Lysinibacillus sp. NPDC056232]